jgi:septum formation protein
VTTPIQFILASGSPRRTELLTEAGIPHKIIVSQATEHEDPTSNPRDMVLHNARIKAVAVSKLHPHAFVLGADTTVSLGNRVLNKPANLDESREMLRSLSGREHTVHTGVCFIYPPLKINETHDITAWVRFKPFGDDVITRYQAVTNTLDKAGAYGIQQGKDLIIESFQEPISTIMGLPIEFVVQRIKELGLENQWKRS